MMECAMHTNVILPAEPVKKAKPHVPVGIWLAGVAVRTIFLLILTALTARVAGPQVETMRSLFETPSDVVRVALGLAVCVWLVVNLFILPKDPGAYRTWMYLGPALLPLTLLCAYVVW